MMFRKFNVVFCAVFALIQWNVFCVEKFQIIAFNSKNDSNYPTCSVMTSDDGKDLVVKKKENDTESIIGEIKIDDNKQFFQNRKRANSLTVQNVTDENIKYYIELSRVNRHWLKENQLIENSSSESEEEIEAKDLFKLVNLHRNNTKQELDKLTENSEKQEKRLAEAEERLGVLEDILSRGKLKIFIEKVLKQIQEEEILTQAEKVKRLMEQYQPLIDDSSQINFSIYDNNKNIKNIAKVIERPYSVEMMKYGIDVSLPTGNIFIDLTLDKFIELQNLIKKQNIDKEYVTILFEMQALNNELIEAVLTIEQKEAKFINEIIEIGKEEELRKLSKTKTNNYSKMEFFVCSEKEKDKTNIVKAKLVPIRDKGKWTLIVLHQQNKILLDIKENEIARLNQLLNNNNIQNNNKNIEVKIIIEENNQIEAMIEQKSIKAFINIEKIKLDKKEQAIKSKTLKNGVILVSGFSILAAILWASINMYNHNLIPSDLWHYVWG